MKSLCKIRPLYWLLSFVYVWDAIEFFPLCFNEAHLVPQTSVLLIIQSFRSSSILYVVRGTLNRSSFWIEPILLNCIYWCPFTNFQWWLVMEVLPSQVNLLNLLDCLLFLILICRVVYYTTICCNILTVAFLLVQACRPLRPFIIYSCLLCWWWATYHSALTGWHVIRGMLFIVVSSVLLYDICGVIDLLFHTNWKSNYRKI